ncbi:MAG: sterol desaturase family protein, partial [Anderseniella sp.]
MPTERPSEPAPRSKWNYHPELPLADKSIFGWPLDIRFLARWFRRSWLSLSERILLLLVAVATWYFLYPGLQQARTFAVGWILQTWVVNMGLMLAVAGSLHWYFYIRRGQGKKLKFDHRDMAKGSRTFTFRNQVHDNMFWSLGSGVFFWTA